MSGDCAYNTNFVSDDTFSSNQELTGDPGCVDVVKENASREAALSPYFEVIDGVLYRKKLEKGYINYREVLDKERRVGAIATFHQKRQGRLHHTLDDTYRYVAENYWWEGMYFQIREYVLNCRECQCHQEAPSSSLVSKTLASHSSEVLSKLKSQQEDGLFCDIILRTDGRSFSAHRAVLAAVSEYFQELFTEMSSSSSSESHIDLTGFDEESFQSLLEFSYTSTLSLKLENLSEVSTMARHFRMWPVVEACKAIQKEQATGLTVDPCTGGCLSDSPCLRPLEVAGNEYDGSATAMCKGSLHRNRKWKWCETELDEQQESGPRASHTAWAAEPLPDRSFKLSLGVSDTACKLARSTGGSLRSTSLDANSFPCSPSRRLKLMDFKSPSNKGKTPPRRLPSGQLAVRVLRSGHRGETGGGPPVTQPSPSRSKKYKQRLCFQQAVHEGTPVKQEPMDEEVQSPRTLEKYQLLSVLGLQRKSLLPGPEELTGWRQKKRLRKLKVDSYSLTARRKPRVSTLELLGPAGTFTANTPSVSQVGEATAFLHRVIKMEPPEPVSLEDAQPRNADCPLVAAVPKQAELRRSVRIRNPPSLALPLVQSKNTTQRRTSLRIKQESASLPIQPPAASTRSHGSARVRHQREPFIALKVKTSARRSCPLDKLTARITREHRDSRRVSSRRSPRAGTEQNSILTRRTTAMKPRTSSQTSGPRRPVRPPDRPRRPRSASGPSGGPSQCPPALLGAVKEEPVEPFPICAASLPELGKRQSRPSVKLLDPGFLFTFCRPIGAIKKEEEEPVDICLTRSGTQSMRPARQERRVRSTADIAGRTRSAVREARAMRRRDRGLRRAESTQKPAAPSRAPLNGFRRTALLGITKPKKNTECPKRAVRLAPLQSCRSAVLETIRRARLKQLRQARARTPVTSHTCFQCKVTYRNCDVLIMHRIRHIEGKHWPCPLCSKTFFRQRNVQSHIRTHDHRLYKCHRCLSAS